MLCSSEELALRSSLPHAARAMELETTSAGRSERSVMDLEAVVVIRVP
jgi:hypothetical protein